MNDKDSSAEEVWNVLLKANKLLLSLHLAPDGDSLGSCVALKYALEKEGKNVKLISKDELESRLMKNRYAKEVVFGKGIDDIELEDYDLVVLLDGSELKRFAEEGFIFPVGKELVVIDHHERNNSFGTKNYIDKEKVSCCSVLLNIFRKLNLKIDNELATRLLLGVYTDSGEFSYDKSAVLEAAFLIEKGADFDSIVRGIRYGVPLKLMNYRCILMQNFKVEEINGKRIGYSTISYDAVRSLGLNKADTRGGANYIQEIEGMDMIFVLREEKDGVKGSLRSAKFDVNRIAIELNGGGHKEAAGFNIENMPLNDVKKKVFEIISKKGLEKIK